MSHTIIILLAVFVIAAVIATVLKKPEKAAPTVNMTELSKEFETLNKTNSIKDRIPEIIIFAMYALKLSGLDENSARITIENWFKNPSIKVSKDKNVREAYTQVARLSEFVKKGVCSEDEILAKMRSIKCSNLF